MRNSLLPALALSLALTLTVELLLALATGKRGPELVLVALVNVLTNPLVVLLYWLAMLYTDLNSICVKAVLEVSAVAAEAWCYKRYGHGFRRPLLFSIATNACSYGAGALIQQLL